MGSLAGTNSLLETRSDDIGQLMLLNGLNAKNGFKCDIFGDSEKIYEIDGDRGIVQQITTDEIDAQEDSLSEMLQSITLDLGSLMGNSEAPLEDNGDRGMMSLVDIYFGEDKNPVEKQESIIEENLFANLLKNLNHSDTSVSSMKDGLFDGTVLNSLLIDAHKDDPKIIEGSEGIHTDENDKGSFSLADLYYNVKNSVDDKLSELSHQKEYRQPLDSTSTSDTSCSVDCELSGSEKFVLCEDEDSVDECDSIDLCSALKPPSIGLDYRHPNPRNHILYRNSDLIKKSPSLFCKVLCAKLKKRDLSSVPRHASSVCELVQEMDYNKYFSFDSPSPDDYVRDKQKNAFK